VGDAGKRSSEDGRKLFSAWDGDDDVVKGGTDTAAAVRREDGFERDVVGRACEDGAECANLANVII
jgi:hypothetical protein